jgi:hypothetical protein
MITRVLDLTVLLLCAVAVLLPRPDVTVQPGLMLDAEHRERVAALEQELEAAPDDLAATLELADLLLDARRPEWALAVATGALAHAPADHRLYARRSLALADYWDAGGAFVAADRALALCQAGSSAPCGEAERGRLQLLRDTLDRVKNVDMRNDPNTAKERILRGLHPVYMYKGGGAAAPAPVKH